MNNEGFTGSLDKDKINPGEYYEVEYWSNKFGVSIERLKSAVRAVGNSIPALEKYLKKAA